MGYEDAVVVPDGEPEIQAADTATAEQEEAERRMSPAEAELSRRREEMLDELRERCGDDPVKIAKLVESVSEDSGPAAFQREYADSRGNSVRMEPQDVRDAENFLINLKEQGKWIKAGSASIRLNRGVMSRASGSEWVQDAYLQTPRSKQHTRDTKPGSGDEDEIHRWLGVARTLKELFDRQ